MMLLLIIINSLLTLYAIFRIAKIDNKNDKLHAQLKDWLFKSLYKLNPKVLLPDEVERPIIIKSAEVYKPEKDPMMEFSKSGLE